MADNKEGSTFSKIWGYVVGSTTETETTTTTGGKEEKPSPMALIVVIGGIIAVSVVGFAVLRKK